MRILLILSYWAVNALIITVTNGGKIGNKILGGERKWIVDYNYQVSIQINNIHICGGAIIGEIYVLTAASCVSSEISNDLHATYAGIKILSGTSNLLQDGPMDLRMFNDVNYIIHHEYYDARKFFKNDIAILKLTEQLQFGIFRNKVGLSLTRDNRKLTYVTGWGEPGCYGNNVQYLQTISVPSKKCQKLYKMPEIYDTQYCLIPRQSNRARITLGNGGSAVMNRRKIVGVLSIISANPILPAVYTYTFEYNYWIQKNTRASRS